jgi:hypothetical protein
VGASKSIQGVWTQKSWDVYPRHQLEQKREIPGHDVELEEPREIKNKLVKPHMLTTYIKKRYAMPKYNTN